MSNRTNQTVITNRLNKKNILVTAVATAIFGTGVVSASPFEIITNTTIDGSNATSAYNATTDYRVGGSYNGTSILTTNSTMSVMYGNIDGNSSVAGEVFIAGNLTMHGNIGGTNSTQDFTVKNGNSLTLSDNSTTYNSENTTLQANSILNLGSNSTSGVNRSSLNASIFSSNVSMAANSTINVGNGTTIVGNIYGASSGQGTLNVVGNFTATDSLSIGVNQQLGRDNATSKLAQINISAGNTFTLNTNATATNMNINGTVTASGNITADVTLGSGGTLNLVNTNATGNAWGDNVGNVTGAIQSSVVDTAQGTLNINGTWQSQGAIGQGGRGLAAINLDNSANATSSPGHTFTLLHSVNATTITIGTSTTNSNATLAIRKAGGTAGENIAITGDIVGGGNSSSTDNKAGGRFFVQGNATISGSIGTKSARLADIRIEDGTTLTLMGSGKNIYANNITMMSSAGQNATLAFNGTGTTNVYGVIAGEEKGEGFIDINAGTVTFNSTLGSASHYVSAINVASGSNMTTNSNIYANETIVILGKLDINSTSGITLVSGNASNGNFGLQIGNNSGTNATLETMGTITLKSSVITSASGGENAAFNNATIKLNGTHSSHATSATAYIDVGTNNQTVTIQGHTTINLDLTNTVITDGATIVIVGRGSEANSNGTLSVSGNVTLTSYKMFDLTVNNGSFTSGTSYLNDASLNATVTYRSSTSLGQTGNTQTVYDASKVAIAADTTVFQALAGMTTDATINAAIKTMSPSTAGGAAASAAISGSSVGTANTRMSYMRQTGLNRGMSAGGAAKDESMWLQIFGASIDQDTVGGVSGYDADGQGLAIGIDGMSTDGVTRIGIAGSFANTDVDGKDSTTRTSTEIDTTQIMVYANQDYSDGMYLQGVASYSFNDNTGTRRILVGAVDRTASSNYDSGLFSIDVEAGWPKEDDGVTITPTVGLTFSHLSADTYTETGAGNMNLVVSPTDVNTVEGKVGVKMTGKTVNADGGIGRPEVRVGVSHNFGDDTADSTSTFNAGGASFTTTGVETDSTKVDVGLGYTYTTPEGDTEISVNVDGRHSSSYVQYGSGLTVKWKF